MLMFIFLLFYILHVSFAQAQILIPSAATPPVIGSMTPVSWNTNGLRNPLNIYLVPGSATDISQSITRIAIDVGNTGTYAWTPDSSIPPQASYRMILIDANQLNFLSGPFPIGTSADPSSNPVSQSVVLITTTRYVFTTMRVTMIKYQGTVTHTTKTSSSPPGEKLAFPANSLALLDASKSYASTTTLKSSATASLGSSTSNSSLPSDRGSTVPLSLSSPATLSLPKSKSAAAAAVYTLPVPTNIIGFNMSLAASVSLAAETALSSPTSPLTGGTNVIHSQSASDLVITAGCVAILLMC